MNRSNLLKLMHKLNKLFKFINKHFYILTFSTWIFKNLSIFKNNKLISSFYVLIKVLFIISIIFTVGLIAYFLDLNTAVNNTTSMYHDLFEPTPSLG